MSAPTTTPASPAVEAHLEAGVRLRRRPGMALLGAALVAAGGLTAGWLASISDDSAAVVVAAGPVWRGHTLTPADLRVARVGGLEALPVTPGEQLASLVGKTATTDLAAGVPVLATSVSVAAVPSAGHTVVGIALSAGQLPTVPLHPGTPVRLIATPRSQDDAPAAAPRSVPATVVAATRDEAAKTTVVNVVVPEAKAASLAALAATGRIALVVDSDEGN